MDPIDMEIAAGRFPPEPTTSPVTIAAGDSYYWDHRKMGRTHVLAVKLAARDMGLDLATVAQFEKHR